MKQNRRIEEDGNQPNQSDQSDCSHKKKLADVAADKQPFV